MFIHRVFILYLFCFLLVVFVFTKNHYLLLQPLFFIYINVR